MDAFLGEIRIFPFNFAPKGWAQCNGQLLQVNQNQALFALLGTIYGGNGQSTFALPNLQGKVIVGSGVGNGMQLSAGNSGGTATYALQSTEMPPHNHQVNVVNALGSQALNNQDDYLAQFGVYTAGPTSPLYGVNGYINPVGTAVSINPGTISQTGGGAAHENRQPYSVLNVCICLSGYFPSRN